MTTETDAQQSWLQISAEVSHQQLEDAENALLESGALSITLSDAADQPLLEPAPGETPTWDNCIITALYADPKELNSILILLQLNFVALVNSELKIEILEDKNWVRAWMDNFTAMPFGKELEPLEQVWVCPSHVEPPEPRATNLFLDPGMAFGTGTHATTAQCLDWIAENKQTHKTVIDYGCGSGLLGIAALKRGADICHAYDIDPLAIEASDDNAEKNGVSAKFIASIKEPTEAADIVYANILANTLIMLYDNISQLCKPNGEIILSGILKEQVGSVISCYEKEFSFSPIKLQDDWACLHAIKTK